MNTLLYRLSSSLLIILFIFTSGCGGGGSTATDDGNTPSIVNGEQTEFALGSVGLLKFPAGSLPENTTVTVEKRTLPLILTDDLVAVGEAFQVDISVEPGLPTEVSLPIPEGESPDNLIIVRLESSSRISLLQTRVDNGMLIALTPGFSLVTAARLDSQLMGFRANLIGPDFLPTGINGQYSEVTLADVPGLIREWHVFETPASNIEGEAPAPMNHQLVVKDTNVLLSAENPGTLALSVEFSEPNTGLNAVAFKNVSVQSSLDSGTELDIAVYGPNFIREGDTFSLKAVVLNTDIIDISRWDWTLGTNKSGSCESECTSRIDIDDITLGEGRSRFTVQMSSATGAVGTADFDINVGTRNVTIIGLSQIPEFESIVWNETFNRNPRATFEAKVIGGTPPYRYEWNLLPNNQNEVHESESTADQFTVKVNQPGTYIYNVLVMDANNFSSFRQYVLPVLGAQPLEANINNVPTEDIITDEPLTLSISVKGGVLVQNGKKLGGYDLRFNWGDDDGSIDYDFFPADDTVQGATGEFTNIYTDPGVYTIKYSAESFYDAKRKIKSINITVVDPEEPVNRDINWKSSSPCVGVAELEYAQRWSVSLKQTDANVTGDIHFHDCPGQGRLSYRLTGSAPDGGGDTFVLDGVKSAGRGDLFSTGPQTQRFTLTSGNVPSPNFAP